MVIMHDPEQQHFGDCARACIASVLELEPHKVPHFYHDGNGENGHRRMQEFLGQHGLYLVQVPINGEIEGEPFTLEQVLQTAEYWTDSRSHYLIGGVAERGCGHYVVCNRGKIVHNPSGDDLTGPQDDGFWWVCIFGKVL